MNIWMLSNCVCGKYVLLIMVILVLIHVGCFEGDDPNQDTTYKLTAIISSADQLIDPNSSIYTTFGTLYDDMNNWDNYVLKGNNNLYGWWCDGFLEGLQFEIQTDITDYDITSNDVSGWFDVYDYKEMKIVSMQDIEDFLYYLKSRNYNDTNAATQFLITGMLNPIALSWIS